MARASPAMTIIAIAEGFGRPHPEEGAQRPSRRMGAAALFLLAMFHPARAVMSCWASPQVYCLSLPASLLHARIACARGAHPFAALGEARRRQRGDGNAQYKGHQRFAESGHVFLLYLSHANQAPHRRATRFYESRP